MAPPYHIDLAYYAGLCADDQRMVKSKERVPPQKPGRISKKVSSPEQEYHSSDDEPNFTLDIPGSRAMFRDHTNPVRRGSWIAMALICFTISIYQIKDRVSLYLEIPIGIDRKIVMSDSLIFPQLTFCTREPFNYTQMEILRPMAAKALNITQDKVSMPYDLLVLMDITTLWENISNKWEPMIGECWFGRNKTCAGKGRWTTINTVMGQCTTYITTNPVDDSGMFNSYYLILLAKPLQSQNKTSDFNVDFNTDGWIYLIHDVDDNPALHIYYGHFLNPSSGLDTSLELTKEYRANVRNNPCTNTSASTCEIICLSKEIIARAGCRLPFMDHSNVIRLAPLCKTPKSYHDADKKLQQMIKEGQWNVGSCNCTRQCEAKQYVTINERVYSDVKPGKFRLRVFYQDLSYEEIKETKIYESIALACDVGNSLGLMLGAGLLTGFRLLEWIGHVFQKFYSSSGRQKVHASKDVRH